MTTPSNATMYKLSDSGKTITPAVEHGGFLGFGQTESFIPVDAITTISQDEVAINHSREHIAAAPPYDPELMEIPEYPSRISSYYGYSPFWNAGYVYPDNLAALSALKTV